MTYRRQIFEFDPAKAASNLKKHKVSSSLVLNNYVGHRTSIVATGRRANTCRRWHVGKEKALGLRQVRVVAVRSGRGRSQALESKVRFADKPEIAEHKPRLQVLILELVPNSESIDVLS